MAGLPTFRNLLSRLLRLIAGPVIGAAIVGYFSWHAVQGERGLIALAQLEADLTEARTVLAALEHEREELENLAGRLRPESLDRDLLEERARTIVNHAHPHDLVILSPSR
jgi:cell division protein FtsB